MNLTKEISVAGIPTSGVQLNASHFNLIHQINLTNLRLIRFNSHIETY